MGVGRTRINVDTAQKNHIFDHDELVNPAHVTALDNCSLETEQGALKASVFNECLELP